MSSPVAIPGGRRAPPAVDTADGGGGAAGALLHLDAGAAGASPCGGVRPSAGLPHSVSFLSGPHIITVQSFNSRQRPGTAPTGPGVAGAAEGPALAAVGFPETPGAGTAVPAWSPSPHKPRAAAVPPPPFAPGPPAGEAAAAAAGGAEGVSDLEAPLLPPAVPPEAAEGQKALRRKIAFAQGLSWVVNIVLLVAKIWVWLLSGSKAVMASAADSAVDLVSQVVISYTEWTSQRADPLFPVGQARLEALGVLGCASIMAVASFEVVAGSVEALYLGFALDELPQLELGLAMYVVLGTATASKLVCFLVCNALTARSDSMVALAEDHANDIMSNLAAVGAALATQAAPRGWWIDPIVAMAISVWIMWRWYAIAVAQVHKLVGRGAPTEFIESLKNLANEHHENLTVDCIRAYHFGTRYLVEMEVVLPAEWTLRQTHDIALMLQHKVEALEDVERAFVHTDYKLRDEPEHKVERALGLSGRSDSGGVTQGASSGNLNPALARASSGSGGGAAQAAPGPPPPPSPLRS